jgi:hypothetical protein
MISTDLLAGLRGIQERALPDSCVITRPTDGADDIWGGDADGTPTAVGTVACRVTLRSEASPSYRPVGGGAEVLTPWEIRVPVGTDLQAKDVVTSNGRSFQVHQVSTGTSYETVRIAYCSAEAS